jgi:hypothetical protein
MSAGIILILTASLLVDCPPLSSKIAAALLIFAGAMRVFIARFGGGSSAISTTSPSPSGLFPAIVREMRIAQSESLLSRGGQDVLYKFSDGC